MSKISDKKRKFQIEKKQKAKEKLRRLKEKYFLAKTKEEKEKIIKKIKKIAPHIQIQKYLEGK
ncbi:MAG TPA: hypothetical protein PLE40_00345 [Candidatus Pacearchaeota archaeon]|jgi:hypothetical protein|nr:hypothetical protein [Candidatus Pacearchaeota archaeon]